MGTPDFTGTKFLSMIMNLFYVLFYAVLSITDLDSARTMQIREVLDCVQCPSYPAIIGLLSLWQPPK